MISGFIDRAQGAPPPSALILLEGPSFNLKWEKKLSGGIASPKTQESSCRGKLASETGRAQTGQGDAEL